MRKFLIIVSILLFGSAILCPFGIFRSLDDFRFDTVDAMARLYFYMKKPYDPSSLKEKLKNPAPTWVQERIDEISLRCSSQKLTDYLGQFSKEALQNTLLLIRIRLINGKIETYPETLNRFQGRLEAVLKALNYLNEENLLPQDLDFILCINDKIFDDYKGEVPIFVFSKNLDRINEKNLILIPDGMNLSRWGHVETTIHFANFIYPWHKKKDILFWRGSNTNPIRLKAAELSKQSSFFDIELTDGRNEQYLIPEYQIQYKYLLSLDGISSSWPGLLWKLASNSVVLKQKSSHVQWYYNGLSPSVHFIEIQEDLNDLQEKFTKAQHNINDGQMMTNAAQNFIKNNVTYEEMLHYMARIFKAYRNLPDNPNIDPIN